MAMTQERYTGLLPTRINPNYTNDPSTARQIVLQLAPYWNAQGGPNSREDIMNDLIRAGFGPDAASIAVYQTLLDNGTVAGNYEDPGTQYPSTTTTTEPEPTEPVYTPEQLAAALESHNRRVKEINAAFGAGLLDFTQKEKLLSQNREDIKTNMAQQQADTSAYFSNISPDAFQSQMGNYNQKILDEYSRNESNLQDYDTLLKESKSNFETGQRDAVSGLNQEYNFNYSPYSGYNANDQLAATYTGGASNTAPALTPVQMSQVGAKLPTARWSPNYGGLSVLQTKRDQQQDIDKYLYA